MTHAFQNVVLWLCLADLAAIACACAFVGLRQVGRWIRSRLRPVALMVFAVAATIVTSEAQKRGGDGGAGTSAQPIVQSIPGAVTNSYWLARGAYEDWAWKFSVLIGRRLAYCTLVISLFNSAGRDLQDLRDIRDGNFRSLSSRRSWRSRRSRWRFCT